MPKIKGFFQKLTVYIDWKGGSFMISIKYFYGNFPENIRIYAKKIIQKPCTWTSIFNENYQIYLSISKRYKTIKLWGYSKNSRCVLVLNFFSWYKNVEREEFLWIYVTFLFPHECWCHHFLPFEYNKIYFTLCLKKKKPFCEVFF